MSRDYFFIPPAHLLKGDDPVAISIQVCKGDFAQAEKEEGPLRLLDG